MPVANAKAGAGATPRRVGRRYQGERPAICAITVATKTAARDQEQAPHPYPIRLVARMTRPSVHPHKAPPRSLVPTAGNRTPTHLPGAGGATRSHGCPLLAPSHADRPERSSGVAASLWAEWAPSGRMSESVRPLGWFRDGPGRPSSTTGTLRCAWAAGAPASTCGRRTRGSRGAASSSARAAWRRWRRPGSRSWRAAPAR